MKLGILIAAAAVSVAGWGASVDRTADLELLGNPAKNRWKDEANPTNLEARTCWQLRAIDGSVYVGMGEYQWNSGPVHVVAYHPETGTFKIEYCAGTESIDDFMKFSDGRIYIPSLDECEWYENRGHFFRRETNGQWKAMRTVPNGNMPEVKIYTHCWDLAEFDGKIHYAGYGMATSTDFGETFTAVTPEFKGRETLPRIFQHRDATNWVSGVQSNALNRIYSLLRVGDVLYGIPTLSYTIGFPYAEKTSAPKPYLWRYVPESGRYIQETNAWDRLLPDLGPADPLCTLSNKAYSHLPQNFIVEKTLYTPKRSYYVATLGYVPCMGCTATLGPDGKLTARKLDFGANTWPVEFQEINGRVYALAVTFDGSADHTINTLFESDDGLTFRERFHFTHRAYARTFCYLDGYFYFGIGSYPLHYRDINHPSAANYTFTGELNGDILRIRDR